MTRVTGLYISHLQNIWMVFIMFLLHELWWAFYEESGSAYEPEAFVNMVSAMDLENVLKFPIAKKIIDPLILCS